MAAELENLIVDNPCKQSKMIQFGYSILTLIGDGMISAIITYVRLDCRENERVLLKTKTVYEPDAAVTPPGLVVATTLGYSTISSEASATAS